MNLSIRINSMCWQCHADIVDNEVIPPAVHRFCSEECALKELAKPPHPVDPDKELYAVKATKDGRTLWILAMLTDEEAVQFGYKAGPNGIQVWHYWDGKDWRTIKEHELAGLDPKPNITARKLLGDGELDPRLRIAVCDEASVKAVMRQQLNYRIRRSS